MPLYEYRCPSCHTTLETTTRDNPICPNCLCACTRRFSFNLPSSFQPHYNPSVGRYVRNEADFKAALSKASDDASEYTGVVHKFVPQDLHDTSAFGLSSADVSEAKDTIARKKFERS